METKFHNIFKNKKTIIGVIHFPPLFGYKDFPGFDIALENALYDLRALKEGGVDAIIIENNYDTPHKIVVDKETVNIMISLGKKIRENTDLPIGVNVLWNDFKSSISIAQKINGRFVRVPVFVDKIKTDYGVIEGNSDKVLAYRKKIGAENIALFTDIQVKHSEILDKKPLIESAAQAIKSGSDALIITGKWTGQAPDIKKLQSVRRAVGEFPILIGSGANKDNIKHLIKYADGIIVSTSLKEGDKKTNEINVKSWKQRINKEKTKELVKLISMNKK